MVFKVVTPAVLLLALQQTSASSKSRTTKDAVERRRAESRMMAASPRKCVETPFSCVFEGPEWDILGSIPHAEKIYEGLVDYCETGNTAGSNTGLLAEASDAAVSGATVEDGMSGDTDFPFMDMKPLLTAGERSVCPESYGYKLTGVPDGMGAMLLDDDTVRVMFQSESYGPLRYESFPAAMNDGNFTMGGSRVQYVDYDRAMMADYLAGDYAAADMVVGVGTMIERAINLKGEPIGPRTRDGPTTYGAHYGNADAEGNYVVLNPPLEADWFYQSFCSAHLEEKHQWGEGIGVEDDIFFTNEEWIDYVDGAKFVGIGFHAVEIATKTAYAMGSTGMGGYEKLAEINSKHPDYVMLALSGYNGNFVGYSAALEARNTEYKRSDGQNYTWTQDIHPARIYVGIKGKMEDGSDAPADDFLARNGLRYGAMYGYAVDMKPENPAKGLWRDDFHRDPEAAANGAAVEGRWIRIPWQWDGVVRDYEHSDTWVYQDKPPFTRLGSGRKDYEWWTAMGPDAGGCKTEHLSSDPRVGYTAFVQGSTCGYFGHYYVEEVAETLAAANGELPNVFVGNYHVYQGELDVREQIMLGGKGQYANETANATSNWDDIQSPKYTFEDVDGLEVLEGPEGKLYAVLQEDSGNQYGERMFLAPLEHERDGKELTYYFLAMSGGTLNTRMLGSVSIPAGTFTSATSHEFSGVFDLSGLLVRDESGAFVLSAAETGVSKRAADRLLDINDKMIMVSLQAHSQSSGYFEAFQLDRGGQIYMLSPKNIE